MTRANERVSAFQSSGAIDMMSIVLRFLAAFAVGFRIRSQRLRRALAGALAKVGSLVVRASYGPFSFAFINAREDCFARQPWCFLQFELHVTQEMQLE